MNTNELATIVAEKGGRAYFVGGMVRDSLLGKEAKDRDIVLTGFDKKTFCSTFPEAKQVIGEKNKQTADVFLLTIENEVMEIALARKEVKTGTGYHGFSFVSSKDTTIEEDLERRDVTINAIAMDILTGDLIDPFNGFQDIKNGIIRATSMAFLEDPLRVYRVAVRHAKEGFSVDTETIKLMKKAGEELQYVHANRVVEEMKKAFDSKAPDKFFRLLQEIDLLHIHFPQLVKLVGVEQPVQHHPEGDAFEHTMLVLKAMRNMTDSHLLLFASLTHDLGKGLTPKERWPRHFGHEEAGVPLVEELSDRLGVPKAWKQAAIFGAKNHGRFHSLGIMRAVKVVDLINEAERNPLKTEGLALLGLADARGKGDINQGHPYVEFSSLVLDSIKKVKGNADLEGKKAWQDKRNRQASCVKVLQKAFIK